MTRPLCLVLFSLGLACSPSEPEEESFEDRDGDGVAATDDCDDSDPALLAAADDADCDGILATDDCDDSDPALLAVADDSDCDGILATDDCDDSVPSSTPRSGDADCDGTPTAEDCDDNDPESTVVMDDEDCDGTPRDDDCSDRNPTSTVRAEDGDCDGVLTEDDCDDSDRWLGARAEDADCDGATTDEDCDDGDDTLGAQQDDEDCDRVLTEDDCDDADPTSTVRAEDGDCDTILTADDCDDADPTSTVRAEDADCDGVLTDADCDDASAEVGPQYGVESCMLRMSAGSFDMGCTAGQSGCGSDESPVMPVTLTRDFFLGETEVTQREFSRMMGYRTSSRYCSTCPVEDLSFGEAAAFANAASAAAGLAECYDCSEVSSDYVFWCTLAGDPYDCEGYRLPTEAEWEFAARCGEDTLYAGSDTASDVGWHGGNAEYDYTQRVATLQPNACGFYDMSGNVWEYTEDDYDSSFYRTTRRTDPLAETSSLQVSVRGGCANSGTSTLRVSDRYSISRVDTSGYLGFRLARTAP